MRFQGKVCARRPGHPGGHYSAEYLERRRVIARAWANADVALRVTARHRAWRASNPGAARELVSRRRAKTRGAACEKVDRAFVWERDAGLCGICGEPADPGRWHLDHVLPLARGGAHTEANVQVSHPRCNQRKGARTAS